MVVGIDRSRGMLGLSPVGFPVAVMDAGQLAFPSETFDLVLLNFILFHLSDPRRGLAETERVLKKGGTVGSVTWVSEPESDQTKIWDEELVCGPGNGCPCSHPRLFTNNTRSSLSRQDMSRALKISLPHAGRSVVRYTLDLPIPQSQEQLQ